MGTCNLWWLPKAVCRRHKRCCRSLGRYDQNRSKLSLIFIFSYPLLLCPCLCLLLFQSSFYVLLLGRSFSFKRLFWVMISRSNFVCRNMGIHVPTRVAFGEWTRKSLWSSRGWDCSYFVWPNRLNPNFSNMRFQCYHALFLIVIENTHCWKWK